MLIWLIKTRVLAWTRTHTGMRTNIVMFRTHSLPQKSDTYFCCGKLVPAVDLGVPRPHLL